MRTLILAALMAALFAAPAPAQLTPGLVPTAEDCVGCNTTFVQPPPIGGHDGCTIGAECDYVPSIPTGPNEGEWVESPCWGFTCGGDGEGLIVPEPVICDYWCIVYNAPNDPPASDPPAGGELSGGNGCGDDSYCTGRHVTIGVS